MAKKFYTWLTSLNVYRFILFCAIILKLLWFIFDLGYVSFYALIQNITLEVAFNANAPVNHPFIWDFQNLIQACIWAPILETLLNQALVIYACMSLKINDYVAIIISAIIFGVLHNFGHLYIMGTTVMGLGLGWAFVYSERKKWVAIAVVSGIHALLNLSSFIIVFIEQLIGKL